MLKQVQHDEVSVTRWVWRRGASRRIEAQSHREVGPVRVLPLDQIAFPVATPVLELLLARDRRLHRLVHLEPDQAVDGILLCEPAERPRAVLGQPLHQVRCDADVERAMLPRGEHVDAGLPAHGGSVTHGRSKAIPSC